VAPECHREHTTAGGLIVDAAATPRAALISRHDRDGRLRWSRPKGHVTAQKTIEEAAVHEAETPTGVRGRARSGATDRHLPGDRGLVRAVAQAEIICHRPAAPAMFVMDACAAAHVRRSGTNTEIATPARPPLVPAARPRAHTGEHHVTATVPGRPESTT
jgi:ADP-ribose pyrophosphatase YjhB (NUDIX family)